MRIIENITIMIMVLKRSDDLYHLRNNSEIKIGDTFFYDGVGDKTQREVIEIVEQRKERGIFNEESDRGFFARVTQQPV